MDFEAIVGKDIWEKHWQNWERVLLLMRESQELAATINQSAAGAYKAL
jgi:hypothetical protein